MLATITKNEKGLLARYTRQLPFSVDRVWAALTQNEQLEYWMPNLQVEDLREGGSITFNFNDGSGKTFDMKILKFEHLNVIQYEWGEGWARFELLSDDNGCLLHFIDYIPIITEHAPKDLAGWHVCLECLYDLLEGKPKDLDMNDWEKWYGEYKKCVIGNE